MSRFHRPLARALCLLSLLAVTACGGAGKVLSVKSDPADADVCIKGRAKSEYFSNAKSCVGSTPFEADRAEVTGPDGDKKTVKFKDVDGSRESFYVVVSRAGYATQSVEVPGWDHFVVLRPEGAPAAPGAAPAPAEKGSVKIVSEPTGALVYINEALKGNTPFTYEGAAGPVKLKLEMDGHVPLEKTLTVEGGKQLTVDLKLVSEKQAAKAAAKAQPRETEPIPVKDAEPVAGKSAAGKPGADKPAAEKPDTPSSAIPASGG